ncbi:MAG: hypothetical protein LIP01_00850 [Tannerellaceae bacterium]|nr:hypothetical protein [Tannerellaceae bacterium]
MATTRQEHHNFDYWIPTIGQFGGDSPIIIGQTCHDGNKVAWPDINEYIVADNGCNIVKTQIQPYYQLNLKEGNEGLEAISREIIHQLETLPHCQRDVPASWVKVRSALKEKKEQTACISYDVFKTICDEAAPGDFRELADYRDCCDFFHRIGVLLWYSRNEYLREHVILRPDWAMNAVYKIIDDKEIQERRGHIYPEDFIRLWNEPAYIEKQSVLKQMLEVFRVAFRKKHKPEEFIMPARLEPAPEDKPWKDEKYIQIEYRFDFMPRGLLNQVSALLSNLIVIDPVEGEEIWSNVVHFEYHDTICQIQESFQKKRIAIRTKGREGSGLLALIEDTLKNTIALYKGVTYTILIPCSCSTCTGGKEPYYFRYDKLREWLGNGSVYKHCNESDERVNIEELLYRAGFAIQLTQPQIKMDTLKRITIFLASSSELEIDRREFEIFINRENKELTKKGIFLNLEVWEDFLDRMAPDGLQEEYNKKIRESDIFVSLFFTKVGKFTDEEFDTAYGQFIQTGKPSVYVYIKNAEVNTSRLNLQDMHSLDNFKNKMKDLKHYPTSYTA